MKQSGAGSDGSKLTENDQLVLDIIGQHSPAMEGLPVRESLEVSEVDGILDDLENPVSDDYCDHESQKL